LLNVGVTAHYDDDEVFLIQPKGLSLTVRGYEIGNCGSKYACVVYIGSFGSIP